ncbi:MAG: LacI family DNA-binding transcriptional regulator [Syntrophothermus sp.]
MMSITIKELADRAMVSIATVSRALNNGGSVKPETRELIIKLAEEMNYRPNILARNFVMKKTNIIGLVLPDAGDEFFSEIIKGVDKAAYSGGYNTMIAGSHNERTLTESVNGFMGKGMVDGVILMAPSVSDNIKAIIRNSTIPVVLINSKKENIQCDTVGVDNFQGAYSMMDYLIKRGYRKIAHISGPATNIDAIQRKKAYTQALEDNKINFRPEWLIAGDFTISGGEYACRRLLSLMKKPEVIFAANDMMSIGCYNAAASLGIRIPEDIGVAGFDDIFVSQFINPRLTTIHVPISELGRNAAELLIRRINEPASLNFQHIRVSTGLVTGNSCK